jgi:hypothetical protein
MHDFRDPLHQEAICSDVGSTSPLRHTRPRHLVIARWQPKIFKMGWREGGEPYVT